MATETFDVVESLCHGCEEHQSCKLIPVEGRYLMLCSSCRAHMGYDINQNFAEITVRVPEVK